MHDTAAAPTAFFDVTQYAYTPDRLLKTLFRPEGDQVSYTNALGRLANVALPGGGSVAYTYDPVTGRLQSAAGLMGVSLAFAYNGRLLTDVTWSGLARAEGFQRRWIRKRGVLRIRRVTSIAKNCASHKPVSATYPQPVLHGVLLTQAWPGAPEPRASARGTPSAGLAPRPAC